MFNKLTLAKKMTISFGIIVIAIIIVGFLNFKEKMYLQNVTENVYNHPLAVSKSTRDIKYLLVAISIEMQQNLFSTEDDPQSLTRIKIDDFKIEIENGFMILREKYLGNKESVEIVYNEYKNFEEKIDDFFAYDLLIQNEEAQLFLEEKVTNSLDIVNRDMEILISFANDKADQFVNEAKVVSKQRAQRNFLISTIIFLIVILIIYFQLISMIKPLRIMKKNLKGYIEGNYKLKLDIKSSDEIGQLSRTLNEMAERISELKINLEQKVEERTIQLKNEIEVSNKKSQNLQTLSTRLNLATEVADIGVWERNLNDNSLTWDNKMFEIFEQEEDDFNCNFKDWMEIIHPDERARTKEEFDSVIRLRINFRIRSKIKTLTGPIKNIEILGLVLVNEFGMADRMVGVARNITEIIDSREKNNRNQEILEREVERRTKNLARSHEAFAYLMEDSNSIMEELEESNKEKERVNKELEAFSYSVSHDLRAPLRSIDGFSLAILEDFGDVFDEDALHYLSRIRKAAQKMSHLIDSMLKLSRISRKNLIVSELDISKFCSSIIDEFKLDNPDRFIEYEVEDNIMLFGDKGLTMILLNNLLENALKYTGEKKKTMINITSEIIGKNRTVIIKDNGVGFNMNFKNKLFAPFQRLHSSTFYEGNGVGLATCMRIVNRHQGEIWAESVIGKGATFYFNFKTKGEKNGRND